MITIIAITSSLAAIYLSIKLGEKHSNEKPKSSNVKTLKIGFKPPSFLKTSNTCTVKGNGNKVTQIIK